MRRADRLFRIVDLLRRRRIVTARWLAGELEVSVRTIYRDIRDLSASGVPIEGEPGVGYLLRDFDLPPLTFSRDEVEALVLGARSVVAWGDRALARAAKSVLTKVEAALPTEVARHVAATLLFAPESPHRPKVAIDVEELRSALRESRRITIAYVDANRAATERTVRPLALAYFGPYWLLAAWCELRSGFRNFRVDRMAELEVWRGLPERTGADPRGLLREPPPRGLERQLGFTAWRRCGAGCAFL